MKSDRSNKSPVDNDAQRCVLSLMKEWMRRFRNVTKVSCNQVRTLHLTAESEYTYLSPQMTKDIYYSLFVHRILQVGHEIDGKVYLVL